MYGGAFLVMAVFFAMLNAHILLAKHHRLARPLSAERRRQILARATAGIVPYAIATALAAVSSYLTLGICAGLALFYALPIGSGGNE